METNVSIVKRGLPTPVSIGSRLREERERLKLNQEAFAKLTSAGTRQSQSNYEKNARSPDARYLAAIAGVGADVLYIVTGDRRAAPPSAFRADVLRDVVEGVEEALQARRQRLAAPKKAELIALLYEQFSKAGQIDKQSIGRFLKLVA